MQGLVPTDQRLILTVCMCTAVPNAQRFILTVRTAVGSDLAELNSYCTYSGWLRLQCTEVTSYCTIQRLVPTAQ